MSTIPNLLRVAKSITLAGSAIGLIGCSNIIADESAKLKCVSALKERLKDPVSYREETPIRVVQEVEGSPKVFGWFFNAKNSFGGYGDRSEALCYSSNGEAVIATIDSDDDPNLKREFLSSTNPKLKIQIREEDSAAAAAASEEREKRIRILKQRCESMRPDFDKGYGSGYLCSQYFIDGTFMESDIEEVQYTDEYIKSL